MISTIKLKINNLTGSDNIRSQKIVKNIFFSFAVKGGSIVVALLLVPMTIHYINPLQYGVWLTISSIVTWMSFFDVGMGNALKNKVTHALVTQDYSEARKFISTTYALISLISICLFIVFSIIIPNVNWNSVLNVPKDASINLSFVLFVVICTFCIQFIMQTVNTVLIATHQQANASFTTFLGQLGVLISIIVLKQLVPGSLNTLIIALTSIPIAVLFITSVILYNGKLKYLRPSFNLINFKYTKNILNNGGIFFVIQIGALLLLQTDNIIISKILGPSYVTVFNVTNRYFTVVTMVFNIFITPYWSAFADAYAQQDYDWMQKAVKRLRKIWLLLSFVAVPILLIASKFMMKLWVGNSVASSMSLSIAMAIYVIGYMCLSTNSFFLNGVGKIRIQFYLYLFSIAVNVPLAIYFGKAFGVIGVTISSIIVFFCMSVVLWIQTNKIISQTAGDTIWNR